MQLLLTPDSYLLNDHTCAISSIGIPCVPLRSVLTPRFCIPNAVGNACARASSSSPNHVNEHTPPVVYSVADMYWGTGQLYVSISTIAGVVVQWIKTIQSSQMLVSVLTACVTDSLYSVDLPSNNHQPHLLMGFISLTDARRCMTYIIQQQGMPSVPNGSRCVLRLWVHIMAEIQSNWNSDAAVARDCMRIELTHVAMYKCPQSYMRYCATCNSLPSHIVHIGLPRFSQVELQQWLQMKLSQLNQSFEESEVACCSLKNINVNTIHGYARQVGRTMHNAFRLYSRLLEVFHSIGNRLMHAARVESVKRMCSIGSKSPVLAEQQYVIGLYQLARHARALTGGHRSASNFSAWLHTMPIERKTRRPPDDVVDAHAESAQTRFTLADAQLKCTMRDRHCLGPINIDICSVWMGLLQTGTEMSSSSHSIHRQAIQGTLARPYRRNIDTGLMLVWWYDFLNVFFNMVALPKPSVWLNLEEAYVYWIERTTFTCDPAVQMDNLVQLEHNKRGVIEKYADALFAWAMQLDGIFFNLVQDNSHMNVLKSNGIMPAPLALFEQRSIMSSLFMHARVTLMTHFLISAPAETYANFDARLLLTRQMIALSEWLFVEHRRDAVIQ